MSGVDNQTFPLYFLEYIEEFGIKEINGSYYYEGNKLDIDFLFDKVVFHKKYNDSYIVKIEKGNTLYLRGDESRDFGIHASITYKDDGICFAMNGRVLSFNVYQDILSNVTLTLSSYGSEFASITINVGEEHLTPQEYLNIVKSKINSNNRVIDENYLKSVDFNNMDESNLFMRLVDLVLDDPHMLRLLTKAMDKMEPDLDTALNNKLKSINNHYNNELDQAIDRINEDRKGAINDTLKYYTHYVDTLNEERNKVSRR